MTEPQPSDGFKWAQAPWGPALQCVPLDAIAFHFFTIGNLQMRGHEAEWTAVADAVDVSRDRLRLVHQVHGSEVAIIRAGKDVEWTPPDADAIVSDDDTVAIAVRVADCAPILLADGRRRAVAAVHAGWRGTMKSVAPAAVRVLRQELGCDPNDLIAAIGPCLGPCCGEMGSEVVEMFRAAGHDQSALERWFKEGASGKPYFDSWRANTDQLEAAGLPRDQIFCAELCTKSHSPLFHSYRAQGPGTGRMLGIIRAG